MDAAVVGGGVIGLLSALRLRQAGLSVTLIDRSAPGLSASGRSAPDAASWAAAGILGPQVESHEPGPLLDLCLASRQLYPALAEELLRSTDLDIAQLDCGALKLAFTEAEEAALVEQARWQSALGLRCQIVRQPPGHPQARLGLHLPDDGQVDNRLLMRALREALSRAGVLQERGEVVALREGEVQLQDGSVRAKDIVLAAGSWSAAFLPEGAVFPVRGQMLSWSRSPVPWTSVVFGAGGYAVPRRDGRLLLGATMEQVGFDRAVTQAGLDGLQKTALRLGLPAPLAPAEQWAGLRPATCDGLPIIGQLRSGIVVATGHFRNGILLAPRTAELVCALVTGRGDAASLPFAPDRLVARLAKAARP